MFPAAPHATPPLAHESRSFFLRPTPPFRLDLTVWALRRRPENILDRWDDETYRRALCVGAVDAPIVEFAVQQVGPPAHPRLRVTVETPGSNTAIEPALRSTLQHMLGLSVDLRDFYVIGTKHKKLGGLIAEFTGFKPPRYPTIFEALLNAVSCQQVSLNVGIMLLNRLVQNFGRPAGPYSAARAGSVARACPSPADLAALPTGALRSLGYSRNKERAILEVSGAVASGKLNPESLRELTDAAALEKLLAIRGIGRWSAEYALLRGMGRLNIFPGDDVGGWNNLQKHLRLRSRPDYEKTRKLLAPWKNYAGLLYFYFLLANLRSRAILP